jgi:ATP-binding cassette subfamily F protein 3
VVDGDTRLTDCTGQAGRVPKPPTTMAWHGPCPRLLHDAGAHDAGPRPGADPGPGLQTNELDNPVNSFSGGWRMRLQLARALMCPSDLLLLDEPTNHLDLDALVWLEAWLKRYEGTMIVISHDREFLDAVTNVTLHIDNAQLVRYGGNYSKFEELRASKMVLQQAGFSKQQDKIAHLQKFIDRFKAKASKAKQAQSRVKALDRMEKIAPCWPVPISPSNSRSRQPAQPHAGHRMTEPAAVWLPPRSRDWRVADIATDHHRNVSRIVLAGQRIGILGANGQGKSTLVKTIARDLAAAGGKSPRARASPSATLPSRNWTCCAPTTTRWSTWCAWPKRLSPQAREQDLRNFLGNFNFSGDMVKQPVGSMSGGEKARWCCA